MKIKKKIVVLVISIVVILFAIYFGVSLYLSSLVREMMEENYSSYGKNINEKYSNFISIEDYEYACYRSDDSNIAVEKNDTNFPYTIWWWDKATVYYDYVYAAYDANNVLICGYGSNITEPITIEFQLAYENGGWKVKSVYEPF